MKHWSNRAALWLASATLLPLSVVVTAGSVLTDRAAGDAHRATVLSDAYARVSTELVNEESLERKYRLQPSAQTRAGLWEASRTVDAALNRIERTGSAADRRLTATIRDDHAAYFAATQNVLSGVDRREDQHVLNRQDDEEGDERFGEVKERIDGIAGRYHERALAAVQSTRRTERVALIAELAAMLLASSGLLLAGRYVVAYQRALREQSRLNQHQASHDALTGLPNRTLFLATAERLLQEGHSGERIGIMVLDLDRFKEVNDTLGHAAGDELIVQVAARLRSCLREDDLVARLGGDEFALLFEHATEPTLADTAARLTRELEQSFLIDGVVLDLEASIGVVCSGDDDVATLMRHADIAMYEAKAQHAPWMSYEPARDEHTPMRLALLGDLRRALSGSDELYLHYQPKINASTGQVCGAEALLRWRHTTRGNVPPTSFIPLAETTGIIEPLTLHVLRMALSQARIWLDDGPELPIAVNISARSLLDVDFPQTVASLLLEYGVPARLLALELTESTIMSDPERARLILRELSEMGIALAIDDFGTGYSSMAYLKDLPVCELKIDRSFVREMSDDPSNAVLVQSTVDLGHNLGLAVVAEGVEDEDVLERLRAMRCDIAQGYFISRPVSSDELSAWLRQRAPLAAIGSAG